MKNLEATVISVHVGNNEDLSKDSQDFVQAEMDGFAGDKHRGFQRVAGSGDCSPKGTIRRNERQWSGVSVEELVIIQERLDLKEPLTATTVGANICIKGVADFSKLPKGTRLKFPSGAILVVEEYNPPCAYIGDQIVAKHTTNSGEALHRRGFPKNAKGLRGVVGVVDVPGRINTGDPVNIEIYEDPMN